MARRDLNGYVERMRRLPLVVRGLLAISVGILIFLAEGTSVGAAVLWASLIAFILMVGVALRGRRD